MDWIRVGYDTKMRLRVGGPLVPVRWYLVPEDTPVFPGYHSFASRVWDNGDGFSGNNPVGEPPDSTFKANQTGPPFLAARPQKFCGNLQWFAEGPPSNAPALVLGADGFPVCCGRFSEDEMPVTVGVVDGNLVEGVEQLLFGANTNVNVWQTEPGTALATFAPAATGQPGFVTTHNQDFSGRKSFLDGLDIITSLGITNGADIQLPFNPNNLIQSSRITNTTNIAGDQLLFSSRGRTDDARLDLTLDNALGALVLKRHQGGGLLRPGIFVSTPTEGLVPAIDGTLPDGSSFRSGLLVSIGSGGAGVTAVSASAPLASSGGTTPQISLLDQTANTVLAGPTTGVGPPTFRALVPTDLAGVSGLTTWSKGTLAYTAFSASSTSASAIALTLPARSYVLALMIKHSVQFTAPGIFSCSANVGWQSPMYQDWIFGYGVNTAPSNTTFSTSSAPPTGSNAVPGFASPTDVRVHLSSNVNLNTLTAGSLDVWVLSGVLP